MAKAKSNSTFEPQVESESPVEPQAEESGLPKPEPEVGTQVILSRGLGKSALMREKLGFRFPAGKKETLPDGTTIYRY